MSNKSDLYNDLMKMALDHNIDVKPLMTSSALGPGSHVHSIPNAYSGYTQPTPRLLEDCLNMTPDHFIIGFDWDGNSRVLKNRVAPARRDEELDLLIELFSRALVKKFLQEKMFLFERTLTDEMVHAIKQTLLKEEEQK
jgi:hypothetical protein